jgi:hypothetical protein
VRRLAALLAILGLAVGCGQSDSQRILSQTADNLAEIHSGDLTLRLVVSPREGTKGRVGFELRGPFALRPGGLPVAKVAYTQITGDREATATFISTGAKAYAEINGKAYELPPDATESVRRAASGGNGGLGGLDISSWVEHPAVEQGGLVGGAPTDHVSADLDVVSAANGLLGLVRQLGRDAPTLEGDQAKQLQDAVESSSFDVWSGSQDHLLRRLVLKAKLGFDVPSSLQRALGEVVGARVEFELGISKPNQPVSVAPPVNPLPSSQLPGG